MSKKRKAKHSCTAYVLDVQHLDSRTPVPFAPAQPVTIALIVCTDCRALGTRTLAGTWTLDQLRAPVPLGETAIAQLDIDSEIEKHFPPPPNPED